MLVTVLEEKIIQVVILDPTAEKETWQSFPFSYRALGDLPFSFQTEA